MDADLIPAGESAKNVAEESNRRAARFGTCDRDGQPVRRIGIRSSMADIPPARYRAVFGHE